MMVPQPTAQYGQVDRVSLARAIFSVRSCAYAGFKSKPNTAAAAPPMVVNLKKSRRVGGIAGAPFLKGRGGRAFRTNLILLFVRGRTVSRFFGVVGDPAGGV